MKIWLINQYALTPNMAGGTRHYDLARQWIERGHEVTIVAAGFHYAMQKEMKQYDQGNYLFETIDGIDFVWIKTRPYAGNGAGRVINMLDFTRKLRKLRHAKRPDVIVGSSVHLFAVFGAYRLAKRFDVPFVMEVRDIWPQTLVDMGVHRWHPFVLLLGWMEAFLYRKAVQIVTLLPRADEHIRSFGIPSDKISWISNGVDLSRFETVQPSNRLDSKVFNILYTGAMGKANNLETLIDACAMLPRSKIAITLVGTGALKEALKTRAEDLKEIRFIEPVSKETVTAMLLEADVLFVGLKDLPLYRYGMSMNKVFDYMAAAKPIVFAAKVPENPVERSGCGIVVSPDDRDAIANAVRTLYNCTEQARLKMGALGKDYVRQHFGMDVIARTFESVLIKAIDEYKTDRPG